MRGIVAAAALLIASSASALLIASSASAQVTYVNDALTAPPSGAQTGVVAGHQGGTFGPGGWTTNGGADTLWYEIPAALPTGTFAFTVTGMQVGATLDGALHDLAIMYGATSAAEPLPYFDDFRSNDFKVQVRVFGDKEPSRPPGASKLEVRFCPAGAPGFHVDCPSDCTETIQPKYIGGLNPLIWNAGAAYRLTVTWSPGKMSYDRGVGPTVTVDYPGTYAPANLRVRLGSPRHTAGTDDRMPIGITFSDVTVSGQAGAATPACGSASTDAGTGGTGGTGAGGTGGTGACLQGVSLVPSNGAGSSQVFRATYSNCHGADAFRIVQIWVGDEVAPGVPSVGGGLENGVFQSAGAACLPGEAKALQNEYGALDCARSSIVGATGNEMVVDWAFDFDVARFGGAHGVFFDAKGGPGDPEPRLGWTQVGTFEVTAATGSGGSGFGIGGGGSWPDGGGEVGAAPGVGGSSSGDRGGVTESDGGCGCRTVDRSRSAPPLALALLALVARRRRARSWRLGSRRGSGRWLVTIRLDTIVEQAHRAGKPRFSRSASIFGSRPRNCR